MKYKVLIDATDSGLRFGEFTKYIHKALLRVGKKPAISYVIESYPSDVEMVVAVAKFAEQIEGFVRLVYAERNIKFIYLEKNDSLTDLKNQLMDQPFIYHNCNLIVESKIEFLKQKNWALNKYLFGIFDHRLFWERAEKKKITELRDLFNLLTLESRNFDVWFDISTPKKLNIVRKKIKDSFDNLDKIEEATFIIDNFVVKFDRDPKLITDKVHRARVLKSLVPKVHGQFNNFFKYEYVEGELYSQAVTPADLKFFLKWCKNKLWMEQTKLNPNEFKKICYHFYYEKTIQRLKRMFESNNIVDEETVINDEKIPPLFKLIEKIDFDWLTKTKQHRIHGDLVLENVIKTKKGYRLIDWRRDFGGDLDVGDIYYDLSKLNHNLTINHKMVEDGHFKFDQKGKEIKCDIFRTDLRVKCADELNKFMEEEKMDKKKLQILTAIIWLNMSPLHPTPKNFNMFLLYFGKYNLWRAFNHH